MEAETGEGVITVITDLVMCMRVFLRGLLTAVRLVFHIIYMHACLLILDINLSPEEFLLGMNKHVHVCLIFQKLVFHIEEFETL